METQPPVVLSRPDAEPRIRTWDAEKKDWVPLSAQVGDSSESSRPPTPPPKSPRHVAMPAEPHAHALPPGAAAPALSLQPELASLGTRTHTARRRPATDDAPSSERVKAQRGYTHTRTKSLFVRRREPVEQAQQGEHVVAPLPPVLAPRPQSWFGALGGMLRRKRTSRGTPPPTPTDTETDTVAEHVADKQGPLDHFGPPPPPPEWERAALDAYAALSVRPRGAR
ncbi:uncharacterized protein LOC62_04G006113 [Vanrija pseudolonga]|uniref:Uncharacterized protein n=1 Tax=Vanrija pseudolonga TaxID=143232 RepID=A0AAF0Y9R1_9TREE|nr:hypothetical protein LOC62_04G006113 [Vanrija pseudolonga]